MGGLDWCAAAAMVVFDKNDDEEEGSDARGCGDPWWLSFGVGKRNFGFDEE